MPGVGTFLLKKLPNSYHSCLLEVRVCAVTGLDDAVAAVEDRDHEHAEGEHVAGRAANWLVLNLRSWNERIGSFTRWYVDQFNSPINHP